MSKHNIYPEFDDQVVARYRKVTVYAVSGKRLNPRNTDERITFILMSDEDAYDPKTKVHTFNYDTDVVELYSEKEQRLFERLNRSAIQAGLLIPYSESPVAVEYGNALTDEQIDEILKISNMPKFKAALKKITSDVAIRRIQQKLSDNHKKWVYDAVSSRLQEITQ